MYIAFVEFEKDQPAADETLRRCYRARACVHDSRAKRSFQTSRSVRLARNDSVRAERTRSGTSTRAKPIHRRYIAFAGSYVIKIKENDGLPHVVCLRCIGALEFLCDFYSCCQHTQRKLSSTEESSKYSSESTPGKRAQQENYVESNKENVLPSSNETKRRNTVLLSPCNKQEDRPGVHTCILQENLSQDGKHCSSATNDAIVREQKSKDGQRSNENENENENASTRGDPTTIAKKGIVDANEQGSEFLNSFAFPMRTSKTVVVAAAAVVNDDKRALAVQPKPCESGRRRRRRRRQTVRSRNFKEAGLSFDIERESRKCSDEMELYGNRRKRQCLRTICTNGTANAVTRDAATILSNAEIELPSEKKATAISTSPRTSERCIGNVEAKHGRWIAAATNAYSNEQSLREEGKDGSSAKSKATPVIVKQEKLDAEAISLESDKSNQLVWIPNEIPNASSMDEDQEIELDLSLRLSLGSEDDTENLDFVGVTGRTVSRDSNGSEQPKTETETKTKTTTKTKTETETNLPLVEEPRATVIRSLPMVVVKPDATNDNIDSKCDLQFSRGGRVPGRDSNSSEDVKNKDRSFAKISELISDEQKEEIETYYRIDMSIVDSERVQENLTVVDKKNIRCNICGSLYLRMDKCQVHVWGHLQMKPFRCKACDFATVTVSNVRCHIRKSHLKIKPFACDVCGKRYVTAGLLEQHTNSHTGARPFKCKTCDFASSTRQMLSYHSSTHKPIKDVNCKICGKDFYSRSKLRTHMIVHKKDKVVVCKLCSAHLSNAEALETHHKNLHTQDYVCNVCGKRMKSKKALHNHQNVHSTGKYKCTLCTNVYKSSQILKEHLLKHEGIRKYKCSVCGKTFGQQSHLAAHMAVHSGIRFHCPGCDKSFNRHDNMKIHTKRCKSFLADPELKNLLIKRERRSSIGKAINESTENPVTAATSTKDSSSSSLNFEGFFAKRSAAAAAAGNEESSINVVDDKEETAMKLGLNISCIESPDKTWTRDSMYQEVGELTGSAELGVIQIVETNDAFVLENDNVRILEIL